MKILILNGPNLNMLGIRKPEIYGIETLDSINNYIRDYFVDQSIEFYQTNHEGDIIDKIHNSHKKYQGIVINPGALTHYSLAVRDAIESCILPVIEVHMSNITGRESFRHESVISPVCAGSIIGFGKQSYILAVEALINNLLKKGK